MKQKHCSEKSKIAAALCCLVLIAVMAVGNAAMVTEPIGRLLRGEEGFAEMTSGIAGGYVSDGLAYKNTFINLNGLFARVTGRRTTNEILRLNNGMLSFYRYLGSANMEPTANRLKAFSDFLASNSSHFIDSILALKEDVAEGILPAGRTNDHDRARGDDLARMLEERGVDYVDVRQVVAATAEQLNRYYYRTDHHWTPAGAFAAFQSIMSHMRSADPSINTEVANADLWERHSQANWFLGSHGKRVGTLFAGTDDLIWYTPKFDTDMSCIIMNHRRIRKGDYTAACLRMDYLNEADYFNQNPYCIYIGGDYPLVQHRNPDAPNHKRVLIIKDSYSLPMQTFFAAAFSEVDVIDPRYYPDYAGATVAEYCAWTKPDYVVLNVLTSMAPSNPYSQFGVNEGRAQAEARWLPVPVESEAFLEAQDNPYNLHEVSPSLEPGCSYRISFADIHLAEGKADGVSVVLFDRKDKRIVQETLYDADYCHRFGGEPWTFRVPAEEGHRYSLLIYAGLYAQTAGNSLHCSGIKLEKME